PFWCSTLSKRRSFRFATARNSFVSMSNGARGWGGGKCAKAMLRARLALLSLTESKAGVAKVAAGSKTAVTGYIALRRRNNIDIFRLNALLALFLACASYA